jgi:hyaluronan synthase
MLVIEWVVTQRIHDSEVFLRMTRPKEKHFISDEWRTLGSTYTFHNPQATQEALSRKSFSSRLLVQVELNWSSISGGISKPGVQTPASQNFSKSGAMMDSTSPPSEDIPYFDSAAAFDSPQRQPLKVNPVSATCTIILSLAIVVALIVSYCIGLRLADFGIVSIGMYGILSISEYLIQFSCAIVNRFDVDRIANALAKRMANAQAAGDCEKGTTSTPSSTLLNPDSEVSIVVVGYREDEKAWRQCLRSLQRQTLRPKCVIGVIDGNEDPDLSMAQAFASEFKSKNAPVIHLPILLSEVHRKTYFENVPKDTRSSIIKFWHYLVGRYRPGHATALSRARQAVVEQVLEWDEKWKISSLDAVCFSQTHSHKRTAMFTAFAISLYAVRTRDAVFTTDSDTLIQDNGLDEMLTLLRSAPQVAGVTAEIKIWNRTESLLTRLCSSRYWFAFNVERACQSLWRCVGCLSGPMSMYRASDLETLVGPWNLQIFGDKQTTFGDDRHMTNQLLAHGLRTRYTHRTCCYTESPTSYVRWVMQQTRWSKSYFREVFWFPASFVYQSAWMLVETTTHAFYPFILIATTFHFLFGKSDSSDWRPLIWLGTMFGVAFLKAILAVIISRDLSLLLFSFYGFIYFLGLLPSKLWALITINQTGWGTSAHSISERRRGQSFLQRSFSIGHLVIWYTAVAVGIGFFLYRIFRNPLYFLIGVSALILSVSLYWEPSKLLGDLKEKVSGVLFKRKKHVSETSVDSQVEGSFLPGNTSSVLVAQNQENLSFISTRRNSWSTYDTTPSTWAVSRIRRLSE